MAGRLPWLCHGTIAPGFISSWRNRSRRPFTPAGSFERSVVARTTSVTSFAAAVLGFWPWPSATFLSAGHSPAVATVATIDIAPAMTPANAARRQFDPSCLLLIFILYLL